MTRSRCWPNGFHWRDRTSSSWGAAPPIWLTEAHPDTLRMEEDGRVQPHGGRQQGSGASATYRRYAVRIAAAMARRYGHNPAVVGWQIDNE
ncbi:MAG: beta-galactosidase, partial [Gammaproteobacteria bacterium]|nr:beta-galactosidase [Gammaproteobacteria bacterium]